MKLNNSDVRRPKSRGFTIISETYKDFAENTSIHGLKYTVKNEVGRHEKIFWLLVVLSGLCGAGYMTVLFWERYTSNPTRTTVLTSYAPTTSVPFPAVTICNINRIILSKVEDFIEELEFNETEESTIRSAFPQLLAFTHPNAIDYNMTELNILQDVLERNGYYGTTSVMEKVSQDCHEMLLYCVWNKKKVPCLEYFKRSISYSGICCSFNYLTGKDSLLHSPFSGLGTGLRVLLNPMLQPVEYSSIYVSGFEIHVHDSTEYLGSQTDSKMLPVGKVQYLQILSTEMACSQSVKNLPVHHRECLYPGEFRLRHFGSQYTDSNCLTECEHDWYFAQCGCVPFYYTFTDKPICNISKIPCLQEIKSNKMIVTKTDSCNCMPQCENTFYNVLSMSSKMKYKESMSMMSFGDNNITEDTVFLNVFFLGNRQTILLKDTITSTIYLLSSFGGVYSLFMGCSLITIAEIFYYGVVRFAMKLNAFGKVNTDIEHISTIKRTNRRNPVTPVYYPELPLHQFYYNGIFLP